MKNVGALYVADDARDLVYGVLAVLMILALVVDVEAVEAVTGIARLEFCSKSKGARVVAAKETLILCGRRLGASVVDLSRLLALDTANVSRRYNSCLTRMKQDERLADTARRTTEAYEQFRKSRESPA